MFLVKKPKVSSFVLTESYFDGATPLTIRFKLNSKICTDFLQVFVEKESSEAILGTHYEIQPATGLSVLRDPLTKDLKTLSFLVEGSKGFFDLYLDPIINLDLKKDLVLNLRIKKSDGYPINEELKEKFICHACSLKM